MLSPSSHQWHLYESKLQILNLEGENMQQSIWADFMKNTTANFRKAAAGG